MEKDIRFHITHYLLLVFFLGLALIFFFLFSDNKNVQFIVGIVTSIVYFIWGMYHHHLEDDLHGRIVVEYLLIALLAILLLRGAIYH